MRIFLVNEISEACIERNPYQLIAGPIHQEIKERIVEVIKK